MFETRSRSACTMILCSLVMLFGGIGCGPRDPLEKVRIQQDEQGDFNGSLEPLRELLKERPDDPEVEYRYGSALIATGNAGFALWPLRKAVESPEWLTKAGVKLAQALISAGSFDEAYELCTRILEKDPDHILTLLLRAQSRVLSHRDYEQALADADRVLELDPENTDALPPRAVALLGLSRVDEAAKVLDDLDGLFRDDSVGLKGSPHFCMARATFAKEKGEQDLAKERFETCLQQFPVDGVVLSGTISFFDEIGDLERSRQILEHALELQPNSYSYRSFLVLRLANAGKIDEAKAVLRAGTELPSVEAAAEAWGGLASFCMDHGSLDEALAAFAKASELDATHSPELQLAYSDALVIAKRFDEALALVDHMNLPAHQAVIRARIELERGNPAGALKLFDDGMRMWPNNAIVRYYSAIAAEQLGNFRRAVEDYRYSMRIDVTATDAYLRLARLHAAAGRYEAALTTLEFSPGGRPEEHAAELLQVRLLTRLGHEQRVPRYLRQELSAPDSRGAALVAFADGVRDRAGPKAALAALRKVKPLELDDPHYVDVLAAMVEDLAATHQAKEGLRLVDAGLRKHPEVAGFHAVRGRALQLSGAPVSPVRSAFEQALALDAKNARALRGLARIEADAGSKEAAVPLYERAIAADESDRTAVRELAAVLSALGRSADAEQRLEGLLREYPFDADAARSLAELRLARGEKDERTVELARRAVAFGGGRDAKEFLARLTPDAGASDAVDTGEADEDVVSAPM